MIKLSNISKTYNDNLIYNNFNIQFEENKISCILGPSGIGKTTLVNMLCGVVKQDHGEIILPDNCKFSYVFQEPRLLEWYDVYENINIVIKEHYNSNERKRIIQNTLELVGLKDYSKYKISDLSGGMAQRVSIARAFAYPSNILILDEAFKGLDIKLEEELISKFKQIWNNDKRTIIFITHNIDQAITLSDNIYVLNNKPVELVYKTKKENYNQLTKNTLKQFL